MDSINLPGETGMSPNGFQRAALAAALGLAVWAGLARASGPTGRYPAAHADAPPGVIVRQEGASPFWDRLRSCKLGCWSSFNNYSCGSFHSEVAFIFGSCRTFFGQPCLAGPPPSPLPPWLNLATPGTAGGPPAEDPWGPNSPWAPGGIGGVPAHPPHPHPHHVPPPLPHPVGDTQGQGGVPAQPTSLARPQGAVAREPSAWPAQEGFPAEVYPEGDVTPEMMDWPTDPAPRRPFWRLRRWLR